VPQATKAPFSKKRTGITKRGNSNENSGGKKSSATFILQLAATNKGVTFLHHAARFKY
jgi:hypothetical protein